MDMPQTQQEDLGQGSCGRRHWFEISQVSEHQGWIGSPGRGGGMCEEDTMLMNVARTPTRVEMEKNLQGHGLTHLSDTPSIQTDYDVNGFLGTTMNFPPELINTVASRLSDVDFLEEQGWYFTSVQIIFVGNGR
uniref:Uncharacterized protein n=1 Tax=Molossus molossus TaxID=27622 RepID=A0A7J8I7V3_MOLMO|nr:hypothetical protein HJG59_010521 [Molossus molossus]